MVAPRGLLVIENTIDWLGPNASYQNNEVAREIFAALGAHVVEFGVVNRSIHQVDECCAVGDIDRLHDAYRGILRRTFAAAG